MDRLKLLLRNVKENMLNAEEDISNVLELDRDLSANIKNYMLNGIELRNVWRIVPVF